MIAPLVPLALALAVAAPPEAAFTVGGHLLDPDGAPAAGATVTVLPLDAGGRPFAGAARVAGEGTSADDGRFEVALSAQPERLRVLVEHGGRSAIVADGVETVAGRHELGPLRIAPEILVEGTVVDEDGAPIAGVFVFADDGLDWADRQHPNHRWNSSFFWLAATDADGRFSSSARPEGPPLLFGPVDLAFAGEGFALEVRRGVDLADARRRRLDVTLVKAESVAGVVVDAGDDRPVPQATVRMVDARTGTNVFGIGHRTDDGGRFVLPPVPADRSPYALEIEHHAFPTQRVPLEPWPVDGEIRFAPGMTLRCRSSETGGAAGPTCETLRAEAYTRVDGGGWRRTVEEVAIRFPPASVREERWSAEVPPADRLRLVARAADGRTSAPVELDPAETNEATFVFAPFRSVSGVVDGGAAGVRVEIGLARGPGHLVVRAATTTDADGRFRFEGIEAARHVVRAWTDGRTSPLVPVDAAGGDVDDLAVATAPAPTVIAEVTVGGAPPAVPLAVDAWRFVPHARGDAWRIARSAVTGPDGTAVLGPLAPGTVVIEARRPPSRFDAAPRSFAIEVRRDLRDHPGLVSLPAAGATRVEVDATFPPRSEVLGVVRAGGRPLEAASVLLPPNESHAAPPAAATTDRRGRFRIVVDGGGDRTLSLRAGTLRHERTVTIAPGASTGLEIDLAAGPVVGTIDAAAAPERPPQVVLERPGGEAGGWIESARALAGEGGAFRFDLVAAGRYRVRLEDGTRTLADVAGAPFAVEGVEGATVPPLLAPRGATLAATLEVPTDGRPPFATLEVEPAPGAPPFPHPVRGWFVGTTAVVSGLRPGPIVVRVVPHGDWTAGDAVTVELDAEGGTTRVTLPVAPAD
ncbi:MAG: carboxypeptidase regulatory-like domain-containing protein [Planctomycetota bacterium JB042]